VIITAISILLHTSSLIGEVVEEGLALFDDRDARERAIKSFRLAEIFVTEQERRVARSKPKEKTTAKEEKKKENESPS